MKKRPAILVIGGGMSGITAAVEAAETGSQVYLVEKSPYLGGRVAQMTRYFPKMCPPFCGLEINFRRIKQNPNIKVFTQAEVTAVRAEGGQYEATITVAPQYLKDHFSTCTDCVSACTVERPNDFNFGMDQTKGVYLPHPAAYPFKYTLDPAAFDDEAQEAFLKACPEGTVDFAAEPTTETVKVGGIVVATGWKPYDATKLENLAFGREPNVITNMMMERLANLEGPTKGQILRPSDNTAPKHVVFAQCAGSRDENHLPYCSGVCCLGTLKQVRYVLDNLPETTVDVFYIDIRSPGRYEKMYEQLQDNERVNFVKGKVAKVTSGPEAGTVTVVAEDIEGGRKVEKTADLLVLATGLVPEIKDSPLPFAIATDPYGFVLPDGQTPGVTGAGCAKKPVAVAECVRDATGAALRATLVKKG
jgi:quinone-modifying oxidoreductase, subunit QmoA